MVRKLVLLGVLAAATMYFSVRHHTPAGAQVPASGEPISYYKQVRPIFQANCQGCHQPAKARGDFVMTERDKLLLGGSSGKPAIVPREPGKSHLMTMITPHDGKAEMPRDKQPLDDTEIDLVKRWIAQGAVDDTPASARQRFDVDHPPVYTRPPVIPSLDYSPDGKLLAVAGLQEVLLVDARDLTLAARLIGMSERIQAVRFSPDGKFLAASGGQPGRLGEVQIWDVAKKKLTLSAPVSFDTVFGVSWSPDGTKVAFGCADNTVRAIEAGTGKQVLFQGGHNDWVLDTVFSTDGSHVLSASRDMTVKLTEVSTQRLIDNVTSITPGALKGGVQALARHPKLDHIVAGGSDGTPRVYRIYRHAPRMIGDDANLILELYPVTGRIFAARFSADGKRIAVASSLDGQGEVSICSYDYAKDVPEPIKAIMGKVPGTRNDKEKEALADYKKSGVKELARVKIANAGLYALAFSPDGQIVAAVGADGAIRLIDVSSGKVAKEVSPAPIQAGNASTPNFGQVGKWPLEKPNADKVPASGKVVALDVHPVSIHLTNGFDTAQIVVTARLDNGDLFDATRLAKFELGEKIAEVSPLGLVHTLADGQAVLRLQFGGQSAAVPVTVTGQKETFVADFYRDVNPVLSRLGCNAGTCHGANMGKNGFKLSLRGVDATLDVRALVDDHASRRINLAAPESSLMLLKATAEVPHEGGQLMKPGEANYEILRNWIANGAKLNHAAPRVSRIDIQPINPVLQLPGDKQQIRVLAAYTNGTVRDVTREAFIESGGTDVAAADRKGLITGLRRGSAPILARYEGAYAATTLVVMGDRTGFAWQAPPANNRIDELTAAKWKQMKIRPSELCSDLEFLRRVHLDLTGLPPTADDVRAFSADLRNSKVKREAVIDKLIGSPDYVEYWTNKWADLLQVNRKFLGPEGAADFRNWIRQQVDKNLPYDEFARKIMTASGSNKDNPAASYFKIARDPTAAMENTTHLFLGVRFNCNKCHDHPFERWTQDQYYELSAFFAQVDLKTDPASGKRTVGGTAVEGKRPLYEIVSDKANGDVKHERTGQTASPKFPYASTFEVKAEAPRREKFAAWLTAKDNQYFAKSFVNRMWGYMFGAGLIDPIDDIRASNPPTNAELLDYLTREFIQSHFDVRQLQRLIVASRTYQLSIVANPWNKDDKLHYSHATPRRLPAEVLLDSLYRVTGSKSKIPGMPAGTRAAMLPDSGVDLPSGLLAMLGRPPRESACECERTNNLLLGPVLALVNSQPIADAINDPANELARLVEREKDDSKLINELFLRILNRPATAKEIEACIESMREIARDHEKLLAALEKREKEVAAMKPKLEQQRLEHMAKARAELEAWEKEIAPKVAQAEKDKAARTVKLTEELKNYEATLPEKLAAWEKKQRFDVDWVILKPDKVAGPKGVSLTLEADRSISVSGKIQRDVFTVTANTSLRGITAVRLEMLADPKFPAGGPGLAKDGNFVLTEFEMYAAAKGSKDTPKKMQLVQPLADFSQANYGISLAVDGDTTARDRGWAVAPAFGVSHWATFQLKDAINFEPGAALTFKLHHQFDQNGFAPGRFRVAVTTAKEPVGLSLSEELSAIAATPANERNAAQQTALMKYFRAVDLELRRRQNDLAESKKPLPIDPKLRDLRSFFDFVSRPVPEDALLVQLRQDAKMSTTQMANPRLTGAQDIAWALVNSPAFLFNH